MRPSSKNPAIDKWLSDIMGVDRVTTIRKDRCVSCKTSVNKVENNFRDALSLREYSISGLCQTCQDKKWPDFQ